MYKNQNNIVVYSLDVTLLSSRLCIWVNGMWHWTAGAKKTKSTALNYTLTQKIVDKKPIL